MLRCSQLSKLLNTPRGTTHSLGKYCGLIPTCSIDLFQEIRGERLAVDLDATTEALHHFQGTDVPNKTAQARAPLIDLLVTQLSTHAPAELPQDQLKEAATRYDLPLPKLNRAPLKTLQNLWHADSAPQRKAHPITQTCSTFFGSIEPCLRSSTQLHTLSEPK